MAVFNASTADIKKCQRWFQYIFVPFSKSVDNAKYVAYSWEVDNVRRSCERIMDVLKNRIFDMEVNGATDQAFKQLSQTTFKINPEIPNSDADNLYTITVNLMVGFLSYICLTNHIFWDDTSHSEYEKDYFIKTKFGKALWGANCFMSQQNALLQKGLANANKDLNLGNSDTQTRTRSASTGGAAKTQRTISLQNCVGLVSGTKETLNVSHALFIKGDWVASGKTTTPRIFVNPSPTAGSKFHKGDILTVCLGSGQGFDDCVLFFDDLNKANEFMLKCGNLNPASVQNLTVVKQSTSKKGVQNGYFRVNTEFGEAFINAARLGE